MRRFFAFLMLLSVFFTSLSVIAPSHLSAAETKEKMRLAIVDLQAQGVSKVVSVAVTDLIRSDMVDTGRFVIVERSQMDAILKEQGLQQTGCTDSSCAVQLGKLLSANKVLIGEINKLGSDIIITVRIVNVEKGVAEFSTNQKAKNLDEIDTTVKVLVNKLTVRITGKLPVAGDSGAADYYLRGIIPGWGQIYAGKTFKGGIFLGSFAVAGGAWAYTFLKYKDKKDAYNGLDPKTRQATFDSYYDDYKQAYNVMLYTSGLWGLIYLANWMDILFITDSPGVLVRGISFNSGYIAFDMNDRRDQFNPYIADGMDFNISYKINF